MPGTPVRIDAPADTSAGAPTPSPNPEGVGFEGTAAAVTATDPQASEPAAQTQPEATPERPAWLPEKFKDPEAFAKAYTELEKKQSGTPAPEGTDNNKQDPPATPETPPTKGDAKLDTLFATATEEYTERGGQLSQATYDEFQKAGISAGRVNEYIRGREAANSARTTMLTELAGSDDNLQSALTWAQTGMSAGDIAEFNAAVDSDNDARASNAVRNLMSSFNEDGGAAQLVSGVETVRGPSDGIVPFASMQEQMAAQRDPRYRNNDRAFVAQVEKRIAAADAQGLY